MEVNLDQMIEYLRMIAPSEEAGVATEIGRRDHIAFLRLHSIDDPEKWAVVNSPGDSWYSIGIPGGLSLGYFGGGLEDDEVKEVLNDYLEVALSFVRSGAVEATVSWLKFPVCIVSTSRGDRVLKKSLVEYFVGLFRFGRRS